MKLSILALIAFSVVGCGRGEDECRSYCTDLAEYSPGKFCSATGCDGSDPACVDLLIDKCVDRCVDTAADLKTSCTEMDWNSCAPALCCTGWYYSDDTYDDVCT